jgi:hypothetical protein
MVRRTSPGLLVVAALGCGGSANECPPESAAAWSPAESEAQPGELTPVARRYDDGGRPLASRSREPASVDRWQVARLQPPPAPRAVRPRRVGRADIHLHHARLDNAFKTIAAAGRFDVIVPESLSTTVSLDLTAVDPYEAFLALAEAHGLEVIYKNGIAIVGKPQPAAASLPPP